MNKEPVRILVVDDTPAMLAATVRVLRQAGYHVEEAATGTEALAKVYAMHPALVLLDVMLPDLSGWEVLNRIRKDSTLENVSVVLLSSSETNAESQAKGLDSGADGYIARPIPNLELLARVRAILRQRELTDQLRASEERFRLLAKATNDAIWDWDLLTGKVWWNEGFEKLFGFNRDEVEPGIESWTERIHPADKDRVCTSIQYAIAGKNDGWSDEYRFQCKDGTYAFVLDRGHVIQSSDGKPVRMVGGMTDLTERKNAEERLRESELRNRETAEQLTHVLNSSVDVICSFDAEGCFLQVSSACEQVWGYTPEELIGTPYIEKVLPEDRPKTIEEAVAIMAGRTSRSLENRYLRKDGQLVDIHWTAQWSAREQKMFCVARDITEHKRLELQFLRAQRMESIGTLAGGIAHDLNNLLSPIVMGVGLIKQFETREDILSVLNQIELSANRGTDLVKQVLSFASGVEGSRIALSMDHLIHEIQSIVWNTFPKNIQFSWEIDSDLRTVAGDPTQLNQVLLNLCVNARDAMPNGGRLTILVSNKDIDETLAATHQGVASGSYVIIEVRDEGCGMSEETIERAFEPFYTTKELGKGTGLGLSTVAGIVRSHGGFVTVESEPHRGSRFKVFLPASPAEDKPAGDSASDTHPRGNGEMILVVDDEVSILNVAKHTLEAFGYRVLIAESGPKAVEIFASHRDEVSLAITDMMMPVMDGAAVIAALKKLAPELRILASSGMNAIGEDPTAIPVGAIRFLPKPYSADQLLVMVNELLCSAEI